MTMVSRIGLFAYFLIQIISVFKRENYNIATSTTYENLSDSDKTIILNRNNFDIGFALFRGSNLTYSLDYFEYFSVQFALINYVLQYIAQAESSMIQGIFSVNHTQIPGEICQNDRFLGDKATIDNQNPKTLSVV